MNKACRLVQKFLQDDQGLEAIEWAVVGGVLTVLAVAAFAQLGISVAAKLLVMATNVN